MISKRDSENYYLGLCRLCLGHREKSGVKQMSMLNDCETLPCKVGCPLPKLVGFDD